MMMNSGDLTASGNIAAIINTNYKFDIHHIILSGYLKTNGGTYSGGIVGHIAGTND